MATRLRPNGGVSGEKPYYRRGIPRLGRCASQDFAKCATPEWRGKGQIARQLSKCTTQVIRSVRSASARRRYRSTRKEAAPPRPEKSMPSRSRPTTRRHRWRCQDNLRSTPTTSKRSLRKQGAKGRCEASNTRFEHPAPSQPVPLAAENRCNRPKDRKSPCRHISRRIARAVSSRP